MGSNEKHVDLDFSTYFKLLCAERRMTKAELCRLSGVSEATLSRIEAGTQKPSPNTLKRLAPHLLVSVEELMERVGYLSQTQETSLDQSFFRVMQKAKDKGYDANDIDLALDFLERARKRDN